LKKKKKSLAFSPWYMYSRRYFVQSTLLFFVAVVYRYVRVPAVDHCVSNILTVGTTVEGRKNRQEMTFRVNLREKSGDFLYEK